jgi:transposase
MASNRTIFSQLIDFLPVYEFDKCVDRYNGNHGVKSFSCFDQFLCMAFAQLTHRESLRDLETCFRVAEKKLYHSGLRGRMSRSTLADANESRDWRIYGDFAQVLIARARRLHSDEDWGANLKATAYALDSTTIDLCLELFPWAKFRSTKAAVKMHTIIDLRGNIPSFIRITNGKVHDVNFLDEVIPEAGAFYIMDRAYNDFERLKRFDVEKAFFVVRAKAGTLYRRTCSREIDKTTGVRSDQSIVLTGVKTKASYPDELRRVSYYDVENSRKLVFITNNFRLAPTTIAKLYKCRWQVELFFKWIKQHLRIKAFYGTSENAVKTQLWIAISMYVLVAIVRQELQLERSLYEILQILDVMIFEKTPINTVFAKKTVQIPQDDICNQRTLFGD